jgi:ribonuclease HII
MPMKEIPTFDIERESGEVIVAGCDEAGRGPLCGPVVAAAVVFLKRDLEMPKITDSKQMSHSARRAAFDWLRMQKELGNIDFEIGMCSPSEIDEMNILQASLLAMRRAVEQLKTAPTLCLIDGNKTVPNLNCRAVVKGDSKSLSIAAASIIAKETRDKIMLELSEKYPEYGWAQNAGYPTASHLAAIEKYGVNEHYRKTYAPVRKILESGK